MAENKLQHFVPRCHLKPFSMDGKGKSIALLHVASGSLVKAAPIKGQCARNYFYGDDLVIEKALQDFEGGYATIIAKLLAGKPTVEAEDLETLRTFAHLQHRRTEQAAIQIASFHSAINSAIFKGVEEKMPHLDLSPKATIKEALSIWADSSTYLDDLYCCILENNTKEPFITSDDPVVLTNRFYHQRLGRGNYGITSSGVCIYMPLTPNFALLCWDRWVYSMPDRENGFYKIKELSDVRAINSLQLQRAANSVYFCPWEQGEELLMQLAEVRKGVAEPQQRVQAYLPVGVDRSKGVESYVAVDSEDAVGAEEVLYHAAANHLEPTCWPSIPKWRFKVKTFNNGSSAGHVRPSHPTLSRRSRRGH